MRLLLLTRNETGGVLTYVSNFSQYLKRTNVDHFVILYEDTNSFFNNIVLEENVLKMEFSKYSSQKSKFLTLRKHISDEDVLVLNDTLEIEFVNYFQIKNKVIYILHGDIIHYQSYLRKYNESFDDVFCVSRYLKDKYKLIYQRHTFSIVHPMVEDYPLIDRIILDDPIKIVSIGRFEYLKGSDTILNTIEFLQKSGLNFDWTLFIPQSKNDEELLKVIQNSVSVRRGYENKLVLEEIEKMDVLFFPSRSEGFSVAILECLKRGVVVIARDIPMGIPEIIQNDINGIICGSEDEFKLAIKRCLVDKNKTLEMKYNANRITNELFQYDKECKILLDSIMTSEIRKDKKYLNVELVDPKLPEFVIRLYRLFKYALVKKVWS